MQVEIVHYSGAFSETRKLSSTNQQKGLRPNIYWICSHVFELGDFQHMGSTQCFFNIWEVLQWFSANNFTSRDAIAFIF